MDKTSSLVLGIDGLVVDRVLVEASGRRVVHCSTDPELAGSCAVCRQQSSSPKDRVATRPRDIRIGPDRPELLWHKRKWHLPGAGMRAKGVHRGAARGYARAGPDHHPGPAGGGAVDR